MKEVITLFLLLMTAQTLGNEHIACPVGTELAGHAFYGNTSGEGETFAQCLRDMTMNKILNQTEYEAELISVSPCIYFFNHSGFNRLWFSVTSKSRILNQSINRLVE